MARQAVQAQTIPPPGSTDTMPATEIAKRGSNQFSLEHPQNRAGEFFSIKRCAYT